MLLQTDVYIQQCILQTPQVTQCSGLHTQPGTNIIRVWATWVRNSITVGTLVWDQSKWHQTSVSPLSPRITECKSGWAGSHLETWISCKSEAGCEFSPCASTVPNITLNVLKWCYSLSDSLQHFVCFIFREAAAFQRYNQTTLLIGFDQDFENIERISLTFSTGSVIGPKFKLRILQMRLRSVTNPER